MEVGDTIISKVLLFYSIIDSPMHMGETYLSRWGYTVRVRGWFCQDKGGGVRAAKCLSIHEARCKYPTEPKQRRYILILQSMFALGKRNKTSLI